MYYFLALKAFFSRPVFVYILASLFTPPPPPSPLPSAPPPPLLELLLLVLVVAGFLAGGFTVEVEVEEEGGRPRFFVAGLDSTLTAAAVAVTVVAVAVLVAEADAVTVV